MKTSAIIFQVQSTIIVILMVIGIFLRRDRKKHVMLMSTCIIWDILLILQIELNRGAIAKASAAVANTWILNVHVAIAVSTVLFYGLMVWSGRKLLAGDNEIRPRHKLFGIITFVLRLLTYATSFIALKM